VTGSQPFLAELLRKIEAIPISLEPFPHWTADRFLPAEMFEQMAANWPQLDEFVPYPETGRVPPGTYTLRHVIPLNERGLTHMSSGRRDYWEAIAACLGGPTLLHSLLARLSPYAIPGDLAGRLTPDVLLVEDQSGYRLPPHTDAPQKLFTWIVYFADDESRVDLGTTMYKTLDRSLLGAKEVHHPRDRFEVAGFVPYRPNGSLCFLRTKASFHGVEPVEIDGARRRLMIYTCYINGLPGHFKF